MIKEGHIKCYGWDKSGLEGSDKETQCHNPSEIRSHCLEHAH